MMALGRFLLGLALALVAILPVVVAASSWRGRLLPRWSGPPAVLVDVIVVLSTVVISAELLGAVGLFRLVPMTGSLALVGSSGWLLHARPTGRPVASAGAVGGRRIISAPCRCPTERTRQARCRPGSYQRGSRRLECPHGRCPAPWNDYSRHDLVPHARSRPALSRAAGSRRYISSTFTRRLPSIPRVESCSMHWGSCSWALTSSHLFSTWAGSHCCC